MGSALHPHLQGDANGVHFPFLQLFQGTRKGHHWVPQMKPDCYSLFDLFCSKLFFGSSAPPKTHCRHCSELGRDNSAPLQVRKRVLWCKVQLGESSLRVVGSRVLTNVKRLCLQSTYFCQGSFSLAIAIKILSFRASKLMLEKLLASVSS